VVGIPRATVKLSDVQSALSKKLEPGSNGVPFTALLIVDRPFVP
jgi:hypothetical protein